MQKKIEVDKTYMIYIMSIKAPTYFQVRLENFYLTLLSMQNEIQVDKTRMNHITPIKALTKTRLEL